MKFAPPDAVERDSKRIFSKMNTIAEHRRALMDNARQETPFVSRLTEIQPRSRLLINAAIGVILFLSPALRAEEAEKVKVTDLMTKDLANVPGKEVTMITVDYAPGGADPVHRHNASAFVYVLEGSIEMQ
ncbi:MAG TPA: hypothetical protein VFI76_02535, partial [Terrimicrobiaceae bacterium]|nr:hypothetical protein [Terrimicrobiaceae bacterium]